MHISFRQLFFTIASLIALFVIMVFAKGVLVPLSLALLLSFILFPLCRKLERWGMSKVPAAFLSIFIMFLIIGGIIFFFSTQMLHLSGEFSAFQDKLMALFTDVVIFINNNVSFVDDVSRGQLLAQTKTWAKQSAGTLLQSTFSSGATFLTGLLTTVIYTFLFLIYRNGLINALAKFYSEEHRPRVIQMFRNVQKVGQNYLSGMLLLIVILGTANSVGLWIIGIDSPFLFGFLAATLSIIPYIGTTFGAFLPVLYAFMSHDSLWVPVAVAILFWSIQLVESNFLSPKVVGSSLKVNALAAILSLIAGAMVWGVAGMILFLPFAAMLKVVCEEYVELRPVAMLIGNDISEDNEAHKKSRSGEWFKKIWRRVKNRSANKSTKQ